MPPLLVQLPSCVSRKQPMWAVQFWQRNTPLRSAPGRTVSTTMVPTRMTFPVSCRRHGSPWPQRWKLQSSTVAGLSFPLHIDEATASCLELDGGPHRHGQRCSRRRRICAAMRAAARCCAGSSSVPASRRCRVRTINQTRGRRMSQLPGHRGTVDASTCWDHLCNPITRRCSSAAEEEETEALVAVMGPACELHCCVLWPLQERQIHCIGG